MNVRSVRLLHAAALLAVLLCGPVAEAAAARPNILYILADDLGYGDVQCLNPARGRIKTPHLDRLAAEGVTFTDAHSGSAVCTPTRYGLLTGRHAWRTRLQRGVLDGGNDEPLIAAGRITVASFLKQHGYAKACMGKWHLGFQSNARPGKGAKAGGGGGLRRLGATCVSLTITYENHPNRRSHLRRRLCRHCRRTFLRTQRSQDAAHRAGGLLRRHHHDGRTAVF